MSVSAARSSRSIDGQMSRSAGVVRRSAYKGHGRAARHYHRAAHALERKLAVKLYPGLEGSLLLAAVDGEDLMPLSLSTRCLKS